MIIAAKHIWGFAFNRCLSFWNYFFPASFRVFGKLSSELISSEFRLLVEIGPLYTAGLLGQGLWIGRIICDGLGCCSSISASHSATLRRYYEFAIEQNF